jgi:hypothetical protein
MIPLSQWIINLFVLARHPNVTIHLTYTYKLNSASQFIGSKTDSEHLPLTYQNVQRKQSVNNPTVNQSPRSKLSQKQTPIIGFNALICWGIIIQNIYVATIQYPSQTKKRLRKNLSFLVSQSNIIYNTRLNLPRLDLEHAALLSKSLVEIESIEQKVRLVTHALLETLALGLFVVVCQDGLVLGVSALVDDDAGTLAGRKTANISETLLSDDNVEVVLSLVDMSAHGDNARDTVGVGLGRSARGSVHDGVLGVAEEIG